MKAKLTDNSVVTVILFLTFILLVQLGTNEVQPWDEGLYAVRAKSILHFDDSFVDQTAYSLGGLYSSTYPPLTVWAVSASMSLFGENEFSLRLFSVICSALSFLLIALTAKRIVGRDLWLAAPLLLFVSLAWNSFSRQGMTDIPLTAFILLCFYSTIRGMEAESRRAIIFWAAMFMLGFAGGLMTKIVKSLLPLLFVAMLFTQKGYRKQKQYFALFALAGLAVASSWYIYMAVEHGSAFSGALLVPHIFSAVEGNTKSLGFMYYFNQLIISNPLFLVTMAAVAIIAVRRKFRLYDDSVRSYIFHTSLIWFAGVFLMFSLSVTKLLHYTCYLLPSLTLLTLAVYDKRKEIISSDRLRFFLLLSIAAALAWSASFALRQDVRHILSGSLSNPAVGFILLCCLIIVFSFMLPTDSIKKVLPSIEWKLPLIILSILFFRIVLINTSPDPASAQGAKATAGFLTLYNKGGFVYLYHMHTPADSLNPQLAWYTGNTMSDRDSNNRYYPVSLPGNGFEIKALRRIDDYPDMPLVYYLPDDRKLAGKIVKDIIQTRMPINMEKNYILFGVKKYERPKGITI